jgi:hypothetical protein
MKYIDVRCLKMVNERTQNSSDTFTISSDWSSKAERRPLQNDKREIHFIETDQEKGA